MIFQGDTVQPISQFVDGADRQTVENARLLWELSSFWGAPNLGNICGFFHVPHDWRCPCCYRTKAEISRLDKNRNLFCPIVRHHDHLEDDIRGALSKLERGAREAYASSLIRFPPILICNDCNVIDSAAKKEVNAPAYFSFAPHEIAAFISPKINCAHRPEDINNEILQTIVCCVQPIVEILRNRLRDTANNGDSE